MDLLIGSISFAVPLETLGCSSLPWYKIHGLQVTVEKRLPLKSENTNHFQIWKDFRVPCRFLLRALKPFPHRRSIHLKSSLWFTDSFQDHRVWRHSATNQLAARRRHLRPPSVPRPRLPRRLSGIVLPQTPLITVTAGTRKPVEWEVVAQAWMTKHRSLNRLVTRWILSRPV